MIVTPVANEPSALRSSRALKPSAEVLCTTAWWLPGISCDTGTSSNSRLERRIGRQAERDAAVHRTIDVPVEVVMRVRGVHVAEGALQRVARIDRAAAGGLEQDVDRLGAQGRGIGAVAAVAGALLEARQPALADDAGRLVAIEQDHGAGRVGDSGCFREVDLQGDEIG